MAVVLRFGLAAISTVDCRSRLCQGVAIGSVPLDSRLRGGRLSRDIIIRVALFARVVLPQVL